MPNSLSFLRCALLAAALASSAICQDASNPASASPKSPLDHVIGTINAIDKTAHTVTVKEDKTGTEHVVQLADTKTLLKVEPTAKDLKGAVRITADDLEAGDRVDVRGTKPDGAPTSLNARSVILMSGRALEATHQQQSAAWAHATAGRVTAVDLSAGTITADVRSAGEVKPVTIQTSKTTEFTRYSADSGKADPSQLAQIQSGDQVKVVGENSSDGGSVTAERVYSGAFRTLSATITAIGADGKSMTVKDLATKKDVSITLNNDAAIHKLPPMMAGMLARRLNPGAAAAAGAPGAGTAGAGGTAPGAGGSPAGAPAGGPPAAAQAGGSATGMHSGGPGGMPGAGGRGDVSQMIEHSPTVAITDLKPGDALVISGVSTGSDNSHLVANTLIAGVEPILQSAPQQRGGGRSVGGDWGLGEMSSPQ